MNNEPINTFDYEAGRNEYLNEMRRDFAVVRNEWAAVAIGSMATDSQTFLNACLTMAVDLHDVGQTTEADFFGDYSTMTPEFWLRCANEVLYLRSERLNDWASD